MKFHTLATAAFATILLGSSLFAQKPDKPTTPNDEPRASQEETAPKSQQDQSQEAQDAKWQMKQQMFARCLVIANQEQVDLARYASEKSTNEDVKQFATAMVKAHTTCIEHLNDVSTQNKTAKKPEKSVAKTLETANATDFVQLHQEIATQCLEDSKEYLNTKEAADFDKCFVGMQIAKHASMHSALTVLQRHTKGKLQEIVKSGLEENDQHMELALKLMDQLAANDAFIASKASK